MKRFHKRRQVVVTQDIKSSSLSLDQSLNLALSVFCLLAWLGTCLCDIWTSLWRVLKSLASGVVIMEDRERACWKFQKLRIQEAGCLTFTVTALCSGRSCARHRPSVLFVLIKNSAVCSPCQSNHALAMATCCILKWLTRASVIPVCSSFQPVAPHTMESQV